MSDIVFDDSEVLTMLCNQLNVRASDIVLDSPARRKPNGPRLRRALVHDEHDGLGINFGNDYPGGVTMGGVRVLDVTGDLSFRIFHTDEINAEGGGHPPTETVVLGEVIKTLRNEIGGLQVQITTLAAKANEAAGLGEEIKTLKEAIADLQLQINELTGRP